MKEGDERKTTEADNTMQCKVSYTVSPLICFSVVGALKASQAAAS